MPDNPAFRVGALLIVPVSLALGQTPAAPAFDVASIKPAADLMTLFTSGKPPHIGMQVDGARVDIGSMTLSNLLVAAYKVKPYQIAGPAWINVDRFDIMAKIPEGVSKDLVPEMLQALLAERFGLKLHREHREKPIYALVVGKNGPKMKESPPEADVPPPAAEDKSGGRSIETGNGPVFIKREGAGATVSGGPNGNLKVSMADGALHLEASKMSMAAFAGQLSSLVDRPVVDMTELKGNFQVALEIPIAALQNAARAAGLNIPGGALGGAASPGGTATAAPADAAADPSANGVFESVQKLGLRLEPRKSPVEVLVIDHLDKVPTGN